MFLDTRALADKSCIGNVESDHSAVSARSVAASYKPPMLVTRVRLPACAFAVQRCNARQVTRGRADPQRLSARVHAMPSHRAGPSPTRLLQFSVVVCSSVSNPGARAFAGGQADDGGGERKCDMSCRPGTPGRHGRERCIRLPPGGWPTTAQLTARQDLHPGSDPSFGPLHVSGHAGSGGQVLHRKRGI